jgi:hypothetical protein
MVMAHSQAVLRRPQYRVSSMQHRPQYLYPPIHQEDLEQDHARSLRLLRWLIAGLALLALFLIGLGVIG